MYLKTEVLILNSKHFKNIYLTVDVDANNKHLSNIQAKRKLNFNEIIDLENVYKPFEIDKLGPRLIYETICKSSSGILIGFALKSSKELLGIIKYLDIVSAKISGLIISKKVKREKRNEVELAKYVEQYRLHSRWMDYSPEYVEMQYRIKEKEIDEIIKVCSNYNIDVLFFDYE